MRPENLKPQDVLVACKIFSLGLTRGECTYAGLGDDLGMSSSTAHESVKRCQSAQILSPSGFSVSTKALRDLLLVAVPRVFYATRRGTIAMGLPTSIFAVALAGKFVPPEGALPLVWGEDGDESDHCRGESVAPLYPTVPMAAREDAVVYELLALTDVMRLGKTTDRAIANSLIEKRLGLKGLL